MLHEHSMGTIEIFVSLEKDSRTRGHEVSISKGSIQIGYQKVYSISMRTTNQWNRLSTDCVIDGSVNMFKTKLTNISGRWVTNR